MVRILVYEPLSAGDPETAVTLGPGGPAHLDMLAAGCAMRDALVGDLAQLPHVRVTVAVRQQETGHGPAVRAVTPQPAESAAAFLRRQAPLHEACWVIAPETGGLLLRLHEAASATAWIGCSAEAIRVAASKSATCAVLHDAGILTPRAFAARRRGPWIVKPDDGAGTLQTRWHATRSAAEADLATRLRAGASATAEPFVPGDALSIALIVGPDLARPIAFNRQRLDIDAGGWLHDLGVQPAALASSDPRAAALGRLGAKVAAAMPGLRGYVGIDVVWNEEEGPVVIEVNPRVTCAYAGLSALLHRNLAADILAVHSQQPTVAAHVGA